MITIFYDAQCPLCSSEMRSLKRYDKQQCIRLVDINASDEMAEFPEIGLREANRILHGYDHQGYLLLGLDVTVAAWRAVGKGHRVNFLRWPLVAPFADAGYRWFAANRHRLAPRAPGAASCGCGSKKLKSP